MVRAAYRGASVFDSHAPPNSRRGVFRRRLGSRGSFALPAGQRLFELDIPESVLELCPESVARENLVLPVHHDGETLWFATPDQDQVMLKDKIRFLLNTDVEFIQQSRSDVEQALNIFYGQTAGESADSMLQEFTDTAIDFTETGATDEELLIDALRSDSISERASKKVSRHRRQTPPTLRSLSPLRHPGEGIMFFTIADGERVLAQRPSGKIDVLEGPQRVWKGRTRFTAMRHEVAHPGQFLSIGFRDGREETRMGPSEIWVDPRTHESVSVSDCLDLAAKEAVVVYGTNGEGEASESIHRRVVHGPGLFAPRPGEWLHRFSWHASNGGSRGKEKRPNALNFEKLCLMPDQMYHDVQDVRTADDAVLTIRLMIFFELVDIDRMLDTTRDPIGDFINAATSDVVEFTGKRSFGEFKQETKQLNETSTYGQLLHRAEQCGYQINNVVYRGYGAPDSLQKMHDEAIQTRTRLQLERATEEQAQDVEDYQLKCQLDRSARRRAEQMNEVEHDLELKRRQAADDIDRQTKMGGFQREQKRLQRLLELELKALENQQTENHLDALRSMRVDLTRYLTQGRADQVIEVRGDAQSKPELHLQNGASPKKRK